MSMRPDSSRNCGHTPITFTGPKRCRPVGELVRVIPGGGGKFATSAGAIEVRDPATGTTSKVGSFKVNDQTRQYIYDHRDELAGATVRIEVMEKNPSGTQRAGRFVDFHPDKNPGNDAIATLQMA